MPFITDAYAQAAGATAATAAAPGFAFDSSALIYVLLPIGFYFLLIRPQQKRAKEQKAMMDGIKGGDEVITSGGLLGKVVTVAEQYVTIEVGNVVGAPNLSSAAVEMTVQKSAIQAMLPKGTIKAI